MAEGSRGHARPSGRAAYAHAAWREFVTHSECITSVPGLAFLAGEHVVLQGAVAVCVRVPQRLYVGIEVIGRDSAAQMRTPDIEIGDPGDHLAYDPLLDRWEALSWLTEKESSTAAAFLRQNVSQVAAGLRLPGSVIRVRSRHLLRPSSGCNWSGAFSSALVAAMYLVAGELSSNEVLDWAWQPGQILASQGSVFDRCNRDAWRLENAFHGGKASGYGTFCSLIGGPDPLIYVTAARDRQEPFSDGTGPYPVDLYGHEDLIDEIPYGGARLVDLVGDSRLRGLEHYPGFGVAVVYSGTKKNTGEAIDLTRHSLTDQLVEGAAATLRALNEPEFAAVRDKTLAGEVSMLTSEQLRGSSIEALVSNGQALVDALRRLYDRPRESEKYELVERLGGAVRRVNGSLTQLGLDWPQFYPIASTVYGCADRYGLFSATGVKLTGGGRGGCVVCVVPLLGPSDARVSSEVDFLASLTAGLDELSLQSKNDTTSAGVHIDWLSWRDGTEREGLRVERITGRGEMTGIPPAIRLPYNSTPVEFITIDVVGSICRVTDRRQEICGPTDLRRLRGSGPYSVVDDGCDLFIFYDLRQLETAVFAWGQPVDLEVSASERHGTRRQIVAIALAALSDDLSIPQQIAHDACERLSPTQRSTQGWTRRYVRSRLVAPFNEFVGARAARQARYGHRSLHPVLSMPVCHRGASGADYNFSIALTCVGNGALRVGVANYDSLRNLLLPVE